MCLNASAGEGDYYNVLQECFGGSRAAFYDYYTITGLVERVLPPIWLLLGIPGNIMCAVTWLNQQVRNTSAVYLAMLGVTEAVLLSLTIVTYLDRVYELPTTNLPIWCQAFPALFYLVQYLHPLLILAYSLERWYSVWFPFKSQKGCSTRMSVLTVVLMVLLCGCVSLVQIRFYQYRSTCDVHADIVDSSTGAHVFYTQWTWTIETFLFGIVPLIVLTLNVSVIVLVRRLSRSEIATQAKRLTAISGSNLQVSIVNTNNSTPAATAHKKKRTLSQAATTLTLLSMSFYFIIMSLPVSIATALFLKYEQGNLNVSRSAPLDTLWHDPVWQKHFLYITVRTIIDDVALSQHAVGFYIYFLTSKPFRTLNLRLLARFLPCVRDLLANKRMQEMQHIYNQESVHVHVMRMRRSSTEPSIHATVTHSAAPCANNLNQNLNLNLNPRLDFADAKQRARNRLKVKQSLLTHNKQQVLIEDAHCAAFKRKVAKMQSAYCSKTPSHTLPRLNTL